MKNFKKAFTLTELIVVVAIIGILMLGITVYIGGLGERAKIIEAQGCATSFWGQMNNYVFYALTSKNLRTSDNNIVSPDFYYIQLTGGTSSNSANCTKTNYTGSNWTYCDKIILGYSQDSDTISTYKTYNIANVCRQNQAKIGFYWSGGDSSDILHVRMNKGFAPTSIAERKVFYLQQNGSNETDKLLEGDVIVVWCPDDTCSGGKEVAKWNIDARTQTISINKCRFYKGDDESKCEARE